MIAAAYCTALVNGQDPSLFVSHQDSMHVTSLAHPARWIGVHTEGVLINGLVCLALCTRVNNYGYDVTYKYCIP